MKTLITFLFCTLSVNLIMAQTPPTMAESPIKFGAIKVSTESLPGSTLKWTKITASFTTKEPWMDGVVFSALAVLGVKDSYRLVSGSVRYANIPAGTHNAIFYISPRATARFGIPQAIEVNVLHKEVEADSVIWKDEAASQIPDNWRSLNTYDGVLVNVMSTPWIMLDYEKSPDVLVTR